MQLTIANGRVCSPERPQNDRLGKWAAPRLILRWGPKRANKETRTKWNQPVWDQQGTVDPRQREVNKSSLLL
jgi:hypothetical protein